MIRVTPQNEYPGFDVQVRQPGAAFLLLCPHPNSKQFKKKNYWGRAAKELHAAYTGICAYTAIYLPEQGSVDHFFPTSTHPQLAYEWANYRLASSRVNTTKSNQAGIVDPFEVQDNWFFIDIPSCMLKPNPNLEKALRSRISSTINSLRLNSDDAYVQERCSILIEYATEAIALGFLTRRYPFLAKELVRQGIDQLELRARFKLEIV